MIKFRLKVKKGLHVVIARNEVTKQSPGLGSSPWRLPRCARNDEPYDQSMLLTSFPLLPFPFYLGLS